MWMLNAEAHAITIHICRLVAPVTNWKPSRRRSQFACTKNEMPGGMAVPVNVPEPGEVFTSPWEVVDTERIGGRALT
jgi:hypothetical protein